MDGLEVVSKISGISSEEANAIWQQVKENQRKLEACPRHDFSIDLKPDQSYGKRFCCSKCGGEVDHITKVWYETGVKHGRSSK